MASPRAATEAAQPQPPPSPKSPPTYPDVCGRHRLQVGLQTLNREIGFLEEELHSLNDLQPASSCCKGVNDFVGTNPDPLLLINQKRHKGYAWRRLGYFLNTVSSSLDITFPFVFGNGISNNKYQELLLQKSLGQSCALASHGSVAVGVHVNRRGQIAVSASCQRIAVASLGQKILAAALVEHQRTLPAAAFVHHQSSAAAALAPSQSAGAAASPAATPSAAAAAPISSHPVSLAASYRVAHAPGTTAAACAPAQIA
ncbi:hypothetical protein Taro_038048 [Colocasia esculenta]|uniref:Guanine nucleotide-binding protein subunit gamma 3 n=1 Tax=Colocasia esculenta TaxID=4460 RepID=A0A843WCS5_COLES|nr:hypothetical protein [Colocasia esculenta]